MDKNEEAFLHETLLDIATKQGETTSYVIGIKEDVKEIKHEVKGIWKAQERIIDRVRNLEDAELIFKTKFDAKHEVLKRQAGFIAFFVSTAIALAAIIVTFLTR